MTTSNRAFPAAVGDGDEPHDGGEAASQLPGAAPRAMPGGKRRRPSRAERERQRATRQVASLRRKAEKVRPPAASRSPTAKLSKRDLEVRLAECLADAERLLMVRGSLPPLISFRSALGRNEAMVLDLSSPEAKTYSGDAARVLAFALDAVIAVLWGEVWMVDGDLLDGVRPTDSDRRYEAVVINLEGWANGRIYHLSAVREIVRGPDGKPQALKPRADIASGDIQLRGQMTGWLPPVRPDARTQAEARALLKAAGVRGCHPHRA